MEDYKPLEGLNVTELLLKISNDVSSIKTDMANFKEAQRLEKENTAKDIAEVRSDYKRAVDNVEAKLQNELNELRTAYNNLASEVDLLKHAEEKKYAKLWKTIVAYTGTAVAGMIIAKFPEIMRVVTRK